MKHSPLAPLACRPDGRHYHQLVDLASGRLLPYAIEHDWAKGTGHPTTPDPARPHRHLWTEAGVIAALRGKIPAGDLLLAIRAMSGLPQTGPSVAERPGDVGSWLDNEEAVAMTLHPELRPARLRDA